MTRVRFALKLIIAIILASCGVAVTPSQKPSIPPSGSSSCQANQNHQDDYVYHPDRLQVLAACLKLTGVVERMRVEPDGDLHIQFRLDHQYDSLLTPANITFQNGTLVLEPICVHPVTQSDAQDECAANPSPLQAIPHLQDHIWVEGRYVADRDHHGWHELHPLYRFGMA